METNRISPSIYEAFMAKMRRPGEQEEKRKGMMDYLSELSTYHGYQLPLPVEQIYEVILWGLGGGDTAYYAWLKHDQLNENVKVALGIQELSEMTRTTKIFNPCGHVFKKGEAIYRCRECGLDETCVMCRKCYKESNCQSGHDTYFMVSNGNGGCCDCGDPEAWKRDIGCSFHPMKQSFEANEQINPSSIQYEHPLQGWSEEIKDRLRENIACLIQFVIEQFNQVYQGPRPDISSMQYINDFHENHYAIVVYNDEVHSFEEVIRQVNLATNCGRERARKVAETVDSLGRDVVSFITNKQSCISIASNLRSIDLLVAVYNADAVLKQEAAKIVLDILTMLAKKHPGLRRLICEELCLNYIEEKNISAEAHEESDDWETEPEIYFDLVDDWDRRGILNRNPLHLERQALSGKASPFDSLLIFDHRLWKAPRTALKELIISSLLADYSYKTELGIRFARNYLYLVHAYMNDDREPDYSVTSLSVQVFTTPTVATEIITNRDLNFFLKLLTYLKKYFEKAQTNGIINCSHFCITNRRYHHMFNDLCHLMAASGVKRHISINFAVYLNHFLEFIGLFQSMVPNRRQMNTHIEYESETWVHAFNFIIYLTRFINAFAECFIGENLRDVIFMSRLFLNSNIFSTRYTIKPVQLVEGLFKLIEFDANELTVSFHHPGHWFLARLLQRAHEANIFQECIKVFDEDENDSFDNISNIYSFMLFLLEEPITTLVMMAQIRAGMWVRNGYSLRNQAFNYRSANFRDDTCLQDLYLIQVASVVLKNTDYFLINLLAHFDLSNWFSKRFVDKLDNTEQKIIIVQEFLLLLISIYGERAHIGKMPLELEVQRDVIHALCVAPLSYSEIAKSLPDRLTENALLEQALKQVATFKPPERAMDHGKYELKEEFEQFYDPFYFHYSKSESEKAEEAMKPKRKQKSKGSLSLLDWLPVFPPLTKEFSCLPDFFHSETFARIIFYLMKSILEKQLVYGVERLFELGLHLLMLALINSERREQNGLSNFLKRAIEDLFEEHMHSKDDLIVKKSTIVDLLGQIAQQRPKEISESLIMIDLIISHFQRKGCYSIKDKLESAQTDSKRVIKESDQSTSPSVDSEMQRKRYSSQRRQKKILDEFQVRQQRFLQKMSVEFGSSDEEAYTDINQESDKSGRHGSCILCQEELHVSQDEERPFGLIGLFQPSRFLSYSPIFQDNVIDHVRMKRKRFHTMQSSLVDNSCTSNDLVVEHERILKSLVSDLDGMSPHIFKRRRSCYVSTCTHGVHYDCFEKYLISLSDPNGQVATAAAVLLFESLEEGEFLCPLCKSLGNTILPIFSEKLFISQRTEDSFPLHGKDELVNWLFLMDNFLKTIRTEISWRENFVSRSEQSNQQAAASVSSLQGETSHQERGGRISGLSSTRSHRLILRGIRNFLTQITRTLAHDDPMQQERVRTRLRAVYGVLPRLAIASEEHAKPRELLFIMMDCLKNAVKEAAVNLNNSEQYNDFLNPRSMDETDFLAGMEDFLNTAACTISVIEVASRNDLTIHVGEFFFQNLSESQIHVLKILKGLGLVLLQEANNDEKMKVDLIRFDILESLFSPKPKKNIFMVDDLFHVYVRLLFLEPSLLSQPFFIVRVFFYLNLLKILHNLPIQIVNKINCSFSPLLKGLKEISLLLHAKQGDILVANDSFEDDDIIELIKCYCLPLLRKCGLILHLIIEFVVDESLVDNYFLDEFSKLCSFLKLPLFEDIFIQEPALFQEKISLWAYQLVKLKTNTSVNSENNIALVDSSIQLVPYATHFEWPFTYHLVPLPPRYDAIFEESSQTVCKNCNNVPTDPAICLICRKLLCSQTYCCQINGRGECNYHARECSAGIGVFLILKQCAVLILHCDTGAVFGSPYLDSHGETDIGLRHGRPLFLNDRRYEELQQLWLQHRIPIHIARRLEQSLSLEGWPVF